MSNEKTEIEAKIISIYMGCTLRLTRLKKGLSQHDLALFINTDSVAIGRIERAKHDTPWSKIYILAKALEININQLFDFKTKEEILSLIDECHSKDSKLNENKNMYYENLKEEINTLFSQIDNH